MKLAKLAPTYEYSNNLCQYDKMFNEDEKKYIEEKWDTEFKQSAKDAATCKRSIFIAIFFDDTGCNYIDDSKNNDFSNIARLYNMFPGKGVSSDLFKAGESASSIPDSANIKEDEFDNCFKIYVPGIGTPFQTIQDETKSTISPISLAKSKEAKSWKRINWAYAHVLNSVIRFITEKDDTGMISSLATEDDYLDSGFFSMSKFDQAFRSLNSALTSSNNKGKTEKVNISVFGGGRGACAARALVNLVVKYSKTAGKQNDSRNNDLDKGKSEDPLAADILEGLKNPYCVLPINFSFLGLFDSVAGVGDLALSYNSSTPKSRYRKSHENWASEDSTKISTEINKTTHIVAAHEMRRSYPLDSVLYNSEGKGGYINEFVYPGAHQDTVGGNAYGYKEKSSGSKLSFITLAHMYRSARLAGVPFRAELMEDENLKKDLLFDSNIIVSYNTYIRFIAGGRNSTDGQPTVNSIIFAHKDLVKYLIDGQYLLFLRHKVKSLSSEEEKSEFEFFKNWRYGEISEEEMRKLREQNITDDYGYGRYLAVVEDKMKGDPTYYSNTQLHQSGYDTYEIKTENSEDNQIRGDWSYIKQYADDMFKNQLPDDVEEFFKKYVSDGRKFFYFDNKQLEPSHANTIMEPFGSGYLRLREIYFGDFDFTLDLSSTAGRFVMGLCYGVVDTPRAFVSGISRFIGYGNIWTSGAIELQFNEDKRAAQQFYKSLTDLTSLKEKIRAFGNKTPEDIIEKMNPSDGALSK